ncbi:hypothetical protein MBLNU457_7011t1 [Dothideomycetes sp. NU457]
MSTSAKQTYAFLGATGGCTLNALIPALTAGHTCLALARDPSKLRHLLLTNGLPEPLLANLTITKGDAKNPSDVRLMLSPDGKTTHVTGIVSGIGSTFAWKKGFHLMPIMIQDPTVCESAMAALVSTLHTLEPVKGAARPFVVAVSTTGISDTERDVPLLLLWLYKWLLHVPHMDKRAMEALLRKSGEESLVVRASLLTDGAARGVNAVRHGVETRPAVGYYISRKDVGGWIWENVLRRGTVGDLDGEAVTVTY